MRACSTFRVVEGMIPTMASADSDRGKRHDEEHQLELAFAALDLDEEHRQNLSRRYLNYMDWLESAASRNRRWYYGLRLTATITAAIVPALVVADLGDGGKIAAAVLGVVVAASTATEGFLHLGERWRHYRVVVELLKAEAWLFAQQAGRYVGVPHRAGYTAFVERAEALIHDEVREYVSTVVAERAPGSSGQIDGEP